MKWLGVWLVLAVGMARAEPLTLDNALAAASAHPERRVAEAELEIARAERGTVDAHLDWNVSLEGRLGGGRTFDGPWRSDNQARVVARKPLWDGGRSADALDASDQEMTARAALLFDADTRVRLAAMARFFDVLLADQRYAGDNESMAVAYVSWDNAKDRFDAGELAQHELLALESHYRDVRERREASLQAMRRTRQALAHAMGQPDRLPSELALPPLADPARAAPDYETVRGWVEAGNPQLASLRARRAASAARFDALGRERMPELNAEVTGGHWSRGSLLRDDVSAGLTINVPFWQGRRLDARAAREVALQQKLEAEADALRFELGEQALALVQEIEWLRGAALPAAERNIEARDWALERARAEYEMELKTNLGTAMADTQYAELRRKTAQYRLALAWARLAALAGGHLPDVQGTTP